MSVEEPDLSHALRAHERAKEDLKAANDLAGQTAVAALRALLLLNGGSAVALVAFVGSLATSPSEQLDPVALTLPLKWFTYGAGTAVLATVLAYATSYSLVGGTALRQMQWAHPYVIDTKTSQRWRRTGYLFHLSAIVAGLAALILFFLGVYSMIAAVGADA